jgi:hypothetical protein
VTPPEAPRALAWGAALGVVALGGVLTVGLGAVSALMLAFAFDSPLRTTSTELVMGLLFGGLGSAFASSVAFAAVTLSRGPLRRRLGFVGVGLLLLGTGLYLGSLGLGFFGG